MSAYTPPAREDRTHIRVLLLVGLAVALLSALLAGGARSASPTAGLIAFTRSDGIYVMRADGSGGRRIKNAGTALEGGVSWSPDGSKLVLATRDGIWVMDAEGRDRVRLATAGEITKFDGPTWSPDGRRIAFTAYEAHYWGGSDRDVWVMNADGSNQRRLKETPHLFEYQVDWSCTGGWVVFDSASWWADVYVMRTNGDNLRNLTATGDAIQPGWSPEGRRIVFARPSGIWTMKASGSSEVRLSGSRPGDREPDWSPDGRRIAFVRRLNPQQETSAEIYVMNADGTGVRRLTHNRVADGSPAWQPVLPA